MTESTLPSITIGAFIYEDPSIPGNPNIPAYSENHFSKQRLAEAPCLYINIPHIISQWLLDLQIIPHSATEIALENKWFLFSLE